MAHFTRNTTDFSPELVRRVALSLHGDTLNKSLSTRRELRFGRHGSLSVNVERGVFRDFETGEAGGVVDLCRRVLGNEPGAVREFLEQEGARLGEALPRRSLQGLKPKPERDDPEVERNRRRAGEIWALAFPGLIHTAAEAWFRRRGCWEAAQQAQIRYAELPHPDTKKIMPAVLIPRVLWPSRRVQSIERKFLTADGDRYPDRDRQRKQLGRIGGGAVAPLFRPASVLVIGEGLETALSATMHTGAPSWATLGGFPDDLDLPPVVRSVLIFADNDEHKREAGKATSLDKARALGEALAAKGLHVSVAMAAAVGADANDLPIARPWEGLPGGVEDVSDTLRLEAAPTAAQQAWAKEYEKRGELFGPYSKTFCDVEFPTFVEGKKTDV